MIRLRSWPGQINDILELTSKIEGDQLILVEIGSNQGESMELFANSKKFKNIYCIDPWSANYDENDMASNFDYNEVEKAFDERAGKFNFIKKIKDKSLSAVNIFEDNSIDIAYIDGMHTKEAVYEDIISWLPKIKNTGYISGHDWYYEDGFLQESIIKAIGIPDHICKHVNYGGDSDGSWIKKKCNINK